MKTVCISIYDGDTEKNILRSGVLDTLLYNKDLQIVLLVRTSKDVDRTAYYKKEFGRDRVIIEPIYPAMTRFEDLMYYLSWNTLPTRSAYVKRHDLYLIHKNKIRYGIESIFGFLGRFKLWRNLIRWGYFVLPDSYGRDIFSKYKPDLFFSPNMFSAEDCRLLRQARKMGIRTLTMAKSWDVPTTRGFTRVKADEILVFNEINKEEIVAIGEYEVDKVHPVGFPQFDVYYDQSILETREHFYERMGADPSKELVLFGVPGDFKNPYSHEIMKDLDDAIEAGKFIKPIQVLARFHPKYPSKGESLKLKHFIFDRPGTYFSKDLEKALDAPQSTTFQWTYTNKDIYHLANSLKHSKVTVNTESTLTLDAAALDRPVVLIGFDGRQELDYWHSIIRNYSREHLSAVLETNGVKLAHNFDELVSNINRYLEDENVDTEERARLRERLLYKTDGHAAERIADHIIRLIPKEN